MTDPAESASADATTAAPPDAAALAEERLIDAEYKIWKKNTPYLYDFVMTHALEWPSLTCQWLPSTKNLDGNSGSGGNSGSVEHTLLLGTHTTGEQNHLMLASVNLPKSDAVLDNRAVDGSDGAGDGGGANGGARGGSCGGGSGGGAHGGGGGSCGTSPGSLGGKPGGGGDGGGDSGGSTGGDEGGGAGGRDGGG